MKAGDAVQLTGVCSWQSVQSVEQVDIVLVFLFNWNVVIVWRSRRPGIRGCVRGPAGGASGRSIRCSATTGSARLVAAVGWHGGSVWLSCLLSTKRLFTNNGIFSTIHSIFIYFLNTTTPPPQKKEDLMQGFLCVIGIFLRDGCNNCFFLKYRIIKCSIFEY